MHKILPLPEDRGKLLNALREGHGKSSGSLKQNRLLGGLVVSQLAITLILLNSSILLLVSFINVMNDPQGFDHEGVITTGIALVESEYSEDAEIVAFWDRLIPRIEALPGVEAAAVTTKLPFEGGNNGSLLVEGETYDPAVSRPLVERSYISAGYFEAMGIPLLAGRYLEEGEASEGVIPAVVNRAFADQYWPEGNAVGRMLRDNSELPSWEATIVGVVENVRQWSVTYPALPELYAPFPINPWQDSNLVVRSSGDPSLLVSSVRDEVHQLEAQMPLSEFRTVEDIIASGLEQRRFTALLVGLFTIITLFLTLAGTYGVISYYVAQRTHEIGVRVALGAQRQDVMTFVVGRGIKLAVLGVTGGLIGAIFSTAALQSFSFGINPLNLLNLGGGIIFILIIAVIASIVPVARALRVDPVRALQAE